MTPVWLSVLAWAYISVCLGCAAIIAGDIVIGRRRQPMGVMNFVFPITALYFGPLALALYWRWGRASARTAPVPVSRAATTRAAVAYAGGGMPVHGGQNTDPGMAG